uniref:t-SNARE coiled-coil homology domain-containing protein n=2 Tax=Picocystis salinarum TaxID=88271 RepID=A0A7S3XC00_9CHLO|mmetsp:Transcript_2269/g.15094  ORF Transcript_2269/g.15094 Transcript_2269/m.15094 type:complete len:314 (+) Transcript_2269:33-974(+)
MVCVVRSQEINPFRNPNHGKKKKEAERNKDVEMGTDTFQTAPEDAEGLEMEEDVFFQTISEAQKEIRTIRQKLDVLKQTHRDIKMATSTDQVSGIREDMKTEVAKVSKAAAKVKKMLDGLAEMAKEEEQGKGQAKQRMRTSMVAAMRKKLKLTLREFSNLRTQMNDDYREVVDRRYETITGEKASDAMLEHMIETGESESIFQKAILDQGGNFSETINEIKERHDAVMEVEKGLLELHQIFLDMATLVEQQGEMIDNIESQVARASTFTAQGTEVLRDTKTLHKKIKRKQLCLALIVVAIIAAIAIAIILTVR